MQTVVKVKICFAFCCFWLRYNQGTYLFIYLCSLVITYWVTESQSSFLPFDVSKKIWLIDVPKSGCNFGPTDHVIINLCFRPSSAGAPQKLPSDPADCKITINDCNNDTPDQTNSQEKITSNNELTTPTTLNDNGELPRSNRSSSGSVTPTIAIVPPFDQSNSSPYSTRDGEVRHNPVFMES